MWALQQTTGDKKGAWAWLEFDNEPWEAYDSQYYGASLAAVAVGTAPEYYRSTPKIHADLGLLREYLNHEYAMQSPINRAVLLWASAKLPGLLEPERQQAIVNELLSKQKADGGWCLCSLVGAWTRGDGTPLVAKSDGYATGLITFALQRRGITSEDARLKQGLSWLVQNQSNGTAAGRPTL